jgi:hypothetical protein
MNRTWKERIGNTEVKKGSSKQRNAGKGRGGKRGRILREHRRRVKYLWSMKKTNQSCATIKISKNLEKKSRGGRSRRDIGKEEESSRKEIGD